MRKYIIIFILGFFIWQPVYAEKKPGPNEWDFGRVKQGEVLKHDFILKNETSDILEINSVNSSCGCTVSKADKKSLLPQSSTAISVTFNTKGYLGNVKQFVYVNTDNADMAIIKFTIKAEIVKEG
ncbi:MAG: DUF1573 domain-containing protein [Candidatus Omnitrophica bacterium]|nr:DUF1573 domain-containing protein [Candidatus Omnitrophota bacterium]MDD5661260.1 DUF1573 domain-containing protein [Candidatus Omnitrophota bacterium]